MEPNQSARYGILAEEAKELDLAAWSECALEELKYSVYPFPAYSDLTKSGLNHRHSVHKHSSLGHAAIWMQYRVVSLIVSNINMLIFSTMGKREPQGLSIQTQLQSLEERMDILASELCCSVACFFESCKSMLNESASNPETPFGYVTTFKDDEEGRITPKRATILAWPLTIAISTRGVPLAQKQWLQRRLKSVAQVINITVLYFVAEKGEFEFS